MQLEFNRDWKFSFDGAGVSVSLMSRFPLLHVSRQTDPDYLQQI